MVRKDCTVVDLVQCDLHLPWCRVQLLRAGYQAPSWIHRGGQYFLRIVPLRTIDSISVIFRETCSLQRYGISLRCPFGSHDDAGVVVHAFAGSHDSWWKWWRCRNLFHSAHCSCDAHSANGTDRQAGPIHAGAGDFAEGHVVCLQIGFLHTFTADLGDLCLRHYDHGGESRY